jgi:hypothetical protein
MTHRGGLSLSIIIWRIGGGGQVFFCPGAHKFFWQPMYIYEIKVLTVMINALINIDKSTTSHFKSLSTKMTTHHCSGLWPSPKYRGNNPVIGIPTLTLLISWYPTAIEIKQKQPARNSVLIIKKKQNENYKKKQKKQTNNHYERIFHSKLCDVIV